MVVLELKKVRVWHETLTICLCNSLTPTIFTRSRVEPEMVRVAKKHKQKVRVWHETLTISMFFFWGPKWWGF